jgi:GGDEF domain-containing protein
MVATLRGGRAGPQIAAMTLPRVDRTITASVGIAIHPDVAGDSETLLRLADRALYAAKAGGRNRIELAEADGPTSQDEQEEKVRALSR